MPTLTSTIILQNTLEAYRVLFPYLNKFNTDFTSENLMLGQTAIAHIRSLPTAADYDATTGYANGAVSARDQFTDLPLTVDSHKHVPVYLKHTDAIADAKNPFDSVALQDQAWVLGKAMIDSILAKVTSANLSNGTTAATADSDLDVIEAITSQMNTNMAAPRGRIGLVSTPVAQAIALDSRIGSKDYYGQLTGEGGLRMFKGVGGFEAIYEYPGLSANNRATQTFTAATTDICTATAHGYFTGDRVRLTNSGGALPAGLAAATDYYVIKLTADTFKLATTDALATAGTAVDVTGTGSGTHSIVGYENVSGLFFNSEAIALYTGIPSRSNDIAASLGIPMPSLFASKSDPINGFALAHIAWGNPATQNVYSTVSSLWGSAIGRQAGAANALTDRSAVILRTA